MIKQIVEAPFNAVGWLFKDVYGRVVLVLLLTALACLVNYPIQDTKVGIWEVRDTLTKEFSPERDENGKIKDPEAPRDVDKVKRIDRAAIKSRTTIRRTKLYAPWALVTLPFHHVAEREVGVVSEGWDETREHWVKTRLVERTSLGLTLGLDLKGGTEMVYRIVAPEGGAGQAFTAKEVTAVIRRRVDAYGLKEPRIQPLGEDRILVQIPGSDASEIARIRAIITRIGRLEFRIVADEKNSAHVLKEARKLGKAPPGWHYYVMKRKEPKPGQEPTEKLLISDEIGLTGQEVDRVTLGWGGKAQSELAVNLTFTNREAFYRLTKANVGRRLAIVLDDVRDKDGKLVKLGRVHSAPVINEAIPGSAQITGGFTQKTAQDLVTVLRSGSLRTPLAPESEQYVGPYQGMKSIQDGQRAIVIGFVGVVVFILLYYRQAGLVANFALLLNLLILVAALALRNATLTLPGIAGIILTVGTSIDANVLIFERIREELKKVADKKPLNCMRDGHRRALVTIVDANLTTLITAIILYKFGSGPVKGFAVTLSYGIIISMFTAVVVTRILFEALIRAGLVKRILPSFELVKNPHIPFIRMRKAWLTASAALVVAGLLYFFAGPGNRLGIEFGSGSRVMVNLRRKVDAEAVRARLNRAGYANAEVQEVADVAGLAAAEGSSAFWVRFRYVPVVNVKPAKRFAAGEYPDMTGGGVAVKVEVDRPVDPKEMARRLAALGSTGCVIERGEQLVGESGRILHAYTVRRADTSPRAGPVLESNVRTVFDSELITGDIRQAFTDPDGESLLVDEGVRVVSDADGKMVVRVSLRKAETPARIKQVLDDPELKDAEVEPVGPLDAAGRAKVLTIAAKSGTLPAIKSALKANQIATLEPFAQIDKIHPAVASELAVKAGVALVLALLAIIAYIWFRFEFRFGLAAVIALVHDVAITLGALALSGREISLTVIAALLTIIGYSLNDTIVVFDRIRENRRRVRKTRFPEIVNLSINQTLSRTVLTSLTTLVAVVALFVFGGAAIEDFAFTLMVGVVVGTYSSVFIASPVLLMTGEQGALRGPLGTPSARIARPLEGFRASR